MGKFFRGIAADTIVSNINTVIQNRGTLSIIRIIGLLWSGSGVLAAANNAINYAWGIRRMRRGIRTAFLS